jgi:hypothetical protein
MKKRIGFVYTILFVTILSLQLNCVATIQPPPAREEVVVAARPYPDAVWMKGHWQWKRWHREWVWVPGHWQVRRHGAWVIVR